MKTLKIGLIGMVMMLMAAAAMAAPQGMGRDRGPERSPERFGNDPGLACLDLDFEQTKKIREMRMAYEQEVAPLKIQMYERKAELRLLWMQIKADPKQITAKSRQIHDLKWQIEEKKIDFKLRFRHILTPEQLSKYLANMPDGKHKGGMGRGGHHRQGPGPEGDRPRDW